MDFQCSKCEKVLSSKSYLKNMKRSVMALKHLNANYVIKYLVIELQNIDIRKIKFVNVMER